jgi:hypothetical protein
MILTTADTIYVVYARRSARHYWNVYGTHALPETGNSELERICTEFSRWWAHGQFALVKMEFAGERREIPDPCRALPETLIRQLGAK